MIHADRLTKRYGSTLALNQLSLDVPVGSVLGLIGPNGAGKTTFLRLVMGFVLPTSGTLQRGGLSPARIGYLPERAFYPSGFRIGEYLGVVAHLAGLPGLGAAAAVQRLLGELGLSDLSRRRLATCSRGQLQRVGIAQALLGDPPIVLLDEPVAGLDPSGQKFMRDQILALHQAGKTVVLSSHNLGEVARVCTHVAVLNQGRLVQSGPLAAMRPAHAQVTILTGPIPGDLAVELAALGGQVHLAERQVILAGDATAHKIQVLLMLMNAGVDIQDLSERRASLEDVYLEATGQSPREETS